MKLIRAGTATSRVPCEACRKGATKVLLDKCVRHGEEEVAYVDDSVGLASSAVAEADDEIGIAEGSDHAPAINRAWRKLDKERKEEVTS